uniref:Uncharacterized protein n=1 Tax=Panstrongylus lignarius TaxID=156445 RepID=A0A224Y2P3_9HEMI
MLQDSFLLKYIKLVIYLHAIASWVQIDSEIFTLIILHILLFNMPYKKKIYLQRNGWHNKRSTLSFVHTINEISGDVCGIIFNKFV